MNIISKALQGLNPEQLELAKHIYGPCKGVAGPGSGKTHTVVSRVSYMIEQGIPPESILMFSFTKKAAGEMKERVMKRVDGAQGVTVGTYHSFCARTLRKYAHHIGFAKNFSIYDTEDSKKLMKGIIDDDFYKPDVVLKMISDWKSKMVTPAQAMETAPDQFKRTIARFYHSYQKAMKEQNAMDFDDLIGNMIEVLKTSASVKQELNEQYKFIITDESQDSARKDLELVHLLAGEEQNVCFIMDDCQSIYAFRGADIDAVLSLDKMFPGMVTYLLQQNYRSTSVIVGASMGLIAHNKNQIKKEIFTENNQGEKIVIMQCDTQAKEAATIASLIKGLTKKNQFELKDIAILYRLSYISRQVEEALMKAGIPYTIVGGLPFYARKEIKDVMGYIRMLYNNRDRQAFERIINLPKRALGPKAVENILAEADQPDNVQKGLLEVCKGTVLKGKAKLGLDNFNAVMSILEKRAEEGAAPHELVRAVMDAINYESYIKENEEDAEDRIENLMELERIAMQYDTVEDFIYNMSLNSIDDETEVENKVQLLTMHASKGLEFPVVIVAGANEGVSPHFRAETQKQVEEERRLFYVAVSRAEKLLFITRPKITVLRGQSSYTVESRFISEMGDDYLMRV